MNRVARPPGSAEPLTATTRSAAGRRRPGARLQQPLQHHRYGEQRRAAVLGPARHAWPAGSNRRWSTTVARSAKRRSAAPAYPQVWNSGAAIRIRSPARSGIRSMIDASGPKPAGRASAGALGRAGGAGGQHDRAAVALRRAQLAGRRVGGSARPAASSSMPLDRAGRPATRSANSSSCISARSRCSSATAASWAGGQPGVDQHRVGAEQVARRPSPRPCRRGCGRARRPGRRGRRRRAAQRPGQPLGAGQQLARR